MYDLGVFTHDSLPIIHEEDLQDPCQSFICFWFSLLHSTSYLFFLYFSPSFQNVSLVQFISGSIDKVLLVHNSVNIFVFDDFNIHHEEWFKFSYNTIMHLALKCIILHFLNCSHNTLTFLIAFLNTMTCLPPSLISFCHQILISVRFVMILHSEGSDLMLLFQLTFHSSVFLPRSPQLIVLWLWWLGPFSWLSLGCCFDRYFCLTCWGLCWVINPFIPSHKYKLKLHSST